MISSFPEFFTLLKSIFTKEPVSILPKEDNFNYRLALRYISFYHPNLCIYIDEVLNRHDKESMMTDPAICYKTFRAIIPKLPWIKIPFVRKGVTNILKEYNITDEEIKHLAELLECSKREVFLYIQMLCQKR